MNRRLRKTPSIDPAFAAFPLRIARSPVQGYGVYSIGTIPAGRKVIEYSGERIRTREAVRRIVKLLQAGRLPSVYLCRLKRGWVLDGAVGGSGAERVNHSCDPNLSVRRMHGRLYLFSRRRIRPGEELTADYGVHRGACRIPCRCGSPKCRGFLNTVSP